MCVSLGKTLQKMRVLCRICLEEGQGKRALPDGTNKGVVEDCMGEREGGLPETAGEWRRDGCRGVHGHGGPGRGEGDQVGGGARKKKRGGSGREGGGGGRGG